MKWRGFGARLIGLQGRKYKLWRSGNQEWYGGVGVLATEELNDKAIAVRRVNVRVMSLAIVLEEELLRVVCEYAPKCGKSIEEKVIFMKIYQENGPPITRVN